MRRRISGANQPIYPQKLAEPNLRCNAWRMNSAPRRLSSRTAVLMWSRSMSAVGPAMMLYPQWSG